MEIPPNEKEEEKENAGIACGAGFLRPSLVVALGASAGGLEALECFFKHTPTDSGVAFVVVQHLDPSYADVLPELLQRQTAMPVTRITEGMPCVADHVYVIPPNRDLSIKGELFHLHELMAEHAPRLAINYFFRSLAEDLGARSVAVILSGMGADGTQGARAIMQEGGAVFLQKPETAKFDSMIQSAIQERLADDILPVEELPQRILKHLHQAAQKMAEEQPPEQASEDFSGVEKVLILLRRQTGHDFTPYKRSTISRRIERRMGLHHFTEIDQYVQYLRENSQEVELLFKEMLIGVTEFFRDGAVFDRLRDEVIPEMIHAHPEKTVLRAWVAGCSSGEEAYSLAMVFLEALEKISPIKPVSLQIFATDLDPDAIDRARAGVYPESIAKEVSAERLQQFFTRSGTGYQVKKEIRGMVVFARQNLISDAPFTKLDILSCRNLLIYFFADLQKKLLPLFHYCLNPGGILVLGNAETIGSSTDLFSTVGGKERIYRRMETSTAMDRIHFPVAIKHSLPSGRVGEPSDEAAKFNPARDLQAEANHFLLQHYSPAAVLVSSMGDIVFIHGKTGKFLEPAAGRANWNLFAMARDELNHALFEAFQRAIRKKEVIHVKNLRLDASGGNRFVDIAVHPILDPHPLQNMVMVVFSEMLGDVAQEVAGKAHKTSGKLMELSRELRHSQEELQILREEMQTTGEELKSSNEELQSTNEELQSMNEELTTSKEEMQSMNEELQVVNQDLMKKLQDLSRSNNDMKNLLSSTDSATLFLDNQLNVRWFSPQTAGIIHLITSDIGRPITDLVSQLDYTSLVADAQEVLRSLEPKRNEARSKDGRIFAIRIIPYRTRESMIDGLVLTFLDVSESRDTAEQLRECQVKLQKFLDEAQRKPELS